MSGLFRFLTVAVVLLALLLKHVLIPNVIEKKAPEDKAIGKIPVLSQEELLSKYANKSALVIGGTRGVGYGTALAIARAGADVTIVGRSDKSGSRALERLLEASASDKSQTIQFVQGDIGSIRNANLLVEKLVKQKKKYDFLVVSAATFPDWTADLQNEDGFDKPFAIAVVGRFLIYNNMRRFLIKRDARILNVIASGMANVMPLDRDVASGKRKVTNLFESMMAFSLGNELMQIGLVEKANALTKNQVSMVSTHPGILKTDLHRGQGFLFDILEFIMVSLVGSTEEDSGILQASILVSDRLHKAGLSYVDQFGIGRIASQDLIEQKELNLDWLWSLITERVNEAK